MKMYIYFDRNGTIKEVINDESIRRGSSDYNKIYCYLEGNPDIDDIWYLQKNPDGTLTNEVSFVDNIVTKAIPYDSHRDMKYFQDFEEYQFYVFTLSSSYLSQNGLVVATIRVAENNTLWALGELTFNVQANVINSDNDITQSQYDYLLLTISSYRSEFNNELDWMKNLLFYYSDNVDITDTLTLTNHYLDKANGNANPDVNSRCTNYIDLSTYTGFLISGHSQYATTLICTYDENKTFLRSYGDGTSAGLTFTDYQFIPQSDEKFVRFSTYLYTQYPLKVVSLGELAPITDKKQDNYLFNKKYVACGDSFTKGDVIAGTKVYPYLIAQRNNMRFVNMAHNGSYCHYGENGFTNPNNSYYYQNIPLDADIITIAYGLNETSTTIGTKDSADNTTIWGAYNEVLGWITTNIPNAKVGIISNDAWMTYDLRNALQEIASYWGVEFLDLKEYGKPFMISGKYSQDGDTNPSVVTQRTNQYCVSSQNGHPNELGHKVRSYIVENFLRGAYGVDNSYTRKETDTKLDLKADKSDTYSKTEVDEKIDDISAYTKSEIDTMINAKADKTTVEGINTRVGSLETDIADLESVQNVVDVVATKSALNSYDTTKLDVNDKVQVIADETHDGASTIYNWDGTQWQYVGAFGGNSYTKEETYNKTQIDSALRDKADKSDTYTRAVIDSMILTLSTDKADKSDTYTKTEIDGKLEEIGPMFEIVEKELEKKSTVVANPTLVGDEPTLEGAEIDGVKYKVGGGGGGTTVVANPTLSGNETALSGLQVGETKYKVPQGGGDHLYMITFNCYEIYYSIITKIPSGLNGKVVNDKNTLATILTPSEQESLVKAVEGCIKNQTVDVVSGELSTYYAGISFVESSNIDSGITECASSVYILYDTPTRYECTLIGRFIYGDNYDYSLNISFSCYDEYGVTVNSVGETLEYPIYISETQIL